MGHAIFSGVHVRHEYNKLHIIYVAGSLVEVKD